MATTRCIIEDTGASTGGPVLTSGSAYIFATGTAVVSTNPPTGTAVTMHDAATGGNVLTNPIALSAIGTFQAFVETDGLYDVVIVNGTNVSTARSIEAVPVSKGGHLTVTQAPPVIFVDPVNGEAKASGNVDYIGRMDHPYLLLSDVVTDWSTYGIELRFQPSTVQTFPALPFSGASSFTGQVVTTTSTIQLPAFWRVYGAGSNAKGNSSNNAEYVTLIKGNVASAPTLQIGSSSGNPETTKFYMQGIGVTNVATAGRGIDVIKGAFGSSLHQVDVYGCNGDGVNLTKAGCDGFFFDACHFLFNGQGATGGYGVKWSTANGAPNNVSFRSCRITNNGQGGTRGGQEVANGGGEVLLYEDAVGNGGYVPLFIACRFGSAGIWTNGVKGAEILNNYLEVGGADPAMTNPFITIGSDPNYKYVPFLTYSSTLNGAINASTTSVVVTSATGVPSTPFGIKVDNEQMNVTNVAGTTFTVTRGYNGSTAATHIDTSNVVVIGSGWSFNVRVKGNYFHGYPSGQPASTGGHVNVTAGWGCVVEYNNHIAGPANFTATNPAVWFDNTNTRLCEGRFNVAMDANQCPFDTGTAGASIVNPGHATNWGYYYDTHTPNTVGSPVLRKFGSWPA